MTLREFSTIQIALAKRLIGTEHQPQMGEHPLLDQFLKLYYEQAHFGDGWRATYWQGHRCLKCPIDLWVYQEIIWELKPDLIIETGTFEGGSAFFLASILDMTGEGKVITIDVDAKKRPEHPRIEYLTGSSIDPDIHHYLNKMQMFKRCMVILDSDHKAEHVYQELVLFSDLVTPGSYLIVEDTFINRPVTPEHGPGPYEAVQDFLAEHPNFEVDRSRQKHLLTFNPGGYLRRIE